MFVVRTIGQSEGLVSIEVEVGIIVDDARHLVRVSCVVKGL